MERRRQAAEGLKAWREAELQRCAEELRERDFLARIIGESVCRGVETEELALEELESVCRGYSELEHRFERLLMDEGTLELWRESRRPA
jgi:hypothetical protein